MVHFTSLICYSLIFFCQFWTCSCLIFSWNNNVGVLWQVQVQKMVGKFKLSPVRLVKCIFCRYSSFGLQTLTNPHFKASWPRKDLYTSKQSSWYKQMNVVLKWKDFCHESMWDQKVRPNLYGTPCMFVCLYLEKNWRLCEKLGQFPMPSSSFYY